MMDLASFASFYIRYTNITLQMFKVSVRRIHSYEVGNALK